MQIEVQVDADNFHCINQVFGCIAFLYLVKFVIHVLEFASLFLISG